MTTNLDTTQVDRSQSPSESDQRYVAGALIAEKYLLETPLGEGGMGTVWLARNVLLDSPVALKLIHPSVKREDTIARFQLEAQVEARFKHRNIVRVFDFGHTRLGDPFIIMELLDGVTLGDLIRQRGRLDTVEAVQTVLPVIDALCHVHAHGVVHRDLKPDNILLSRNHAGMSPKLLDFGIAKLVDDEPHDDPDEHHPLIGSPPYMAPEQARGFHGVDHRADIWAICVVLYEALSGKQAFPGEGYKPLRAVLEDDLPPLDDTGAGEAELFRVLTQGLQKDPARRLQSMSELGTALAQWLYDRGEREDLTGARLSRIWPIATQQTATAWLLSPADAAGGGLVAVPYATPAKRRRGRLARSIVATAIMVATLAVPSNLRIRAARHPRAVATQAQVLLTCLTTASASALEGIVPRAKPRVPRRAPK